MPSKKQAKKRQSLKTSDIELDDDSPCCDHYLQCPLKARACLKERLFKSRSEFYLHDYLADEEKQLEVMVSQCVCVGESNSVLIIGPRGSGKSKLVHKVLEKIKLDSSDYFYVYLNGIVHTDDRTSLQDMARQLELENVVGDRVFGSFSDNLAFILDALKSDTGKSKSIIIVLDEFDCFTYHKNQALLYNLFDIAQSRQNPLCVIGITCRLDVVELLEKRVKSRYSHRSILTFPNYAFSKYIDITRELLVLPDSYDCFTFKRRWDRKVQVLLEGKAVCDALEKQYNIQKDLGAIVRLLTLPLSNVSASQPFITSEDIVSSYDIIHVDSKDVLLKGLSMLELCLVVAAKHVLERRDGQPFNFEMIFNEYQAFLKRRLTGGQGYSRSVTFKAFEHLISLELFKPTDTSTLKEYKLMSMLLNTSQIKVALDKNPECPTELKNWNDYVFT